MTKLHGNKLRGSRAPKQIALKGDSNAKLKISNNKPKYSCHFHRPRVSTVSLVLSGPWGLRGHLFYGYLD